MMWRVGDDVTCWSTCRKSQHFLTRILPCRHVGVSDILTLHPSEVSVQHRFKVIIFDLKGEEIVK